MKTIRRLYFYLVSLISLEVVIWGLINLLRTIFSSKLTFPGADTLAQAMALIFVGVPIFAVHWIWAQKYSAKDPEEHSASLRALFLYAALLATLIPVVQNLLSFINRTLIVNTGIESYRAFVGGNQTWIDNVIAIFLNLLAAGYFYNVLQNNWKQLRNPENFIDVRRLYRYIWVLYALLMVIFGTQQEIRWLFYFPGNVLSLNGREICINGLALILVGTPIWVFTWNICQKAVQEKLDETSNLRLGVLYLLSLAGVITVLTTSALIINTLLQQILGANIPWKELINRVGPPFSVGLPLAIVWAYYGRWFNHQLDSISEQARRLSLKNSYLYILSLIGVVASFVGLTLLLKFIINILTGSALWGSSLRPSLTSAVATLAVGLPLWLATWLPLVKRTTGSGEMEDLARRSLLRRSYLYLVIFVTVIGGMASAIYLVYTILFGFLDHRSVSFTTDVFNGLQLLCLFVLFLLYYLSVMRSDNAHSADALSAREALFPVAIIEPQGTDFAQPIIDAIKHVSPAIPVATYHFEDGVPKYTDVPSAVILPSTLAVAPSEELKTWLKEFAGTKLVVPVPAQGWYWGVNDQQNSPEETAQVVRQMAEGREIQTHSGGGSSTLQVIAYIFAILFGVELLFGLASLGMSLIIRPGP